jgi:hypothetical protein
MLSIIPGVSPTILVFFLILKQNHIFEVVWNWRIFCTGLWDWKVKIKGALAIQWYQCHQDTGQKKREFWGYLLEEGIFIFSIYWPISPVVLLNVTFVSYRKWCGSMLNRTNLAYGFFGFSLTRWIFLKAFSNLLNELKFQDDDLNGIRTTFWYHD